MAESFLDPVVGGGVGCAVGAVVWRVAGAHRRVPVRPTAGVAAALLFVLGLALRIPVLAVAGPMASWFVAGELERREGRDRDRRRRSGLPIVVDGMVQRLRSGAGLRVVCATPVAIDGEVDEMLRPLVDALARQRPLREAVDALQVEASRRGWHDAQLFGATLAALVDRGGPAATALLRLRLTLMGAIEARSRAGTQAGQARASAALLAGAPALFALVVAVADRDVGRFYLREPLGAVCVAAALLLSQVGWRWMNREVDRTLRGSVESIGRRRERRR